MGKYADTVDQYLDLQAQGQKTQETSLRLNMMSAAETDPDSLARAKKSADMLGLPLQAVQERLPEVEKQAFVEGFGYQDLIKQAPRTAEWLAADPLHAGVAKDDIENLSYMERLFSDIGQKFEQGRMTTELSDIGFAAITGKISDKQRARQSEIEKAMQSQKDYGITGFFEGIPSAVANQLPILGQTLLGKVKGAVAGGAGGAAVGAGTALVAGQLGPQVAAPEEVVTVPAAAVATGARGAVLGWKYGSAVEAGKLEASLAYLDFEKIKDETGQPLDRNIALTAALLVGGVNGALEGLTGVERMVDSLPGIKNFTREGMKQALKSPTVRAALLNYSKRIVTTAGTEGATEFLQNMVKVTGGEIGRAVQEGSTEGLLDRIFSDQNLTQSLAEARAGAQAGGGMATVLAAPEAVADTRAARNAQQTQQVFQAIGDTATNSKLRERLPEKFKELAERYAGAQNAFIDATMFNRYFQSVGIDPAAVAAELGVKNYSEAVSAGTDIVIPMGNFAAQLAPTDHLQGLMPDLKLSQGELSAREYEAQQANEAEQEQEIAGQADPEAPDASRQQIFDDVLGQLVGRYERSTAEAYATQYTAGIATMAERVGIDPLELHQRYGLTITSPLPDVLTKRPDLDTVIDPMIDAIRAGTLPTDSEVNGQSLTEFLRERGGVQDEGGELASRDAKQQVRGLVRDTGMSLDAAREAAAEAGYIAEDSTVSDFIDLLDNELRGEMVYSGRNRNDSLAEQQNALRELSNWLDQQGIDLNSTDNAAIKRMMNPAEEGREFEQATGDVTQTPEFKAWFGDSKVVDAEGKPLVVYHGTAARFDTFRKSDGGTFGDGIYLTKSKEAAQEYAETVGDEPIVMELYASIKNPAPEDIASDIESRFGAGTSTELQRMGYDGIMAGDDIVAFRPEQIKSVNNRGTFDASNPNILFQAAFHGSPYKFDKFTLDHIGSGEGAQAYGWGLYFAGNKEVAEYYRKSLTNKPADPADLAGFEAWSAWNKANGNKKKALQVIADRVKLLEEAKQFLMPGAYEKQTADYAEAKRLIESGEVNNKSGQLYEVEIPNDDTLLLWDKPLSEQPENVRSIFAAIRTNTKNMDVQNTLTDFGMAHLRGMDLYNALNKELGSDEAASKYLHSLGINGIKYLDGTSRNQGDGSYNYVIFDDQAIEIVDTYYQRQQDGARGYIRIGDNQRMSIALLERANLSTFLHETGHMWLEVLGDLATSENAPEQIKQDYKTILDWFGVESRDQIQVEHHEQFARANEAYLMEGKAPSAALRGVFQRFKAWLTMIYRNISRLDVQLTPEVRAVFDRIYASDEEIEAARAEAGMQALFSSAEQMGLTDAEFAAYRNTVTDASVQAQDKLRVELMNGYQREQTKWWNEEREKVRQQVTAEVNALPAYVAFDALVSGAQGKLSKDDLIRRYGEAYLKRIPRGYGEGRGAVYATDGGGMDIDIAAEIFGFESGDALVQALVNMRPRKALIEAETDARMREEYGDMRLDGTIAERAEVALHNDKRAQVLAAELKALDRQLASERGIRRPFGSADPIRAAAKSLVSQQPVNELQPQRYLLAERKASRLAFEALAVKDRVVAFNEKQRELLNHFLYLEATAAQERADKIAAYAESLTKRTTQERIGKAGEEYLDALNEILDAYQFRRTTNKQLQLIAKVRAAVAAADAEGEIIDVMMDEQGNVIDPALLNVRNYRELTIDELEAVRDMLKNIEHVAREKNKFRTAEVQAEFDEIAGKVLDEIADGKPAKPVDVYKLRDPRHQKWRAIPLAIAEWRGLFSYLQEAVGFKQNSTLWNYVMRPLNDAAAREAVMKREAAKQLDALFERYSTTYLYGKGKVIPGVGSVNKQQQLMLAASWGTETGRQRMLDNGFDGRGLSEEQVNSVLDSLDERDWGFVQDLWKLFDSYWKPVADKQQRVTGVRPEQVDALPFMTQFGEMPGGYSPIAYESFLDNRAAAQQAAQIADEMKRAAYTRNTTRRGFLKQRVERIQGKAVRYDFGVIYKHLNEVIHDVTHHETLRDVQKLLNHKLDGRSILDEITQRMGYGVRDQVVETLEEIAVGDLRVMGNSERIMEHLAAGASIAGMAYNVWNAVQNITGIANSIAVIGPSAVMRGAWEWIGTPQHMLGSIDTVQEKSEFMRTRYLNMNRDINALRGKLEQASGRPAVDSAYAAYREGGFWMMIRMQQLVDMPTWIGAYDQAKRDFPDITEANAVALADQAVLAAQGGGRTVDLSKFMRGKGWARVWTVFAGYFNVVYQRTAESMLRAGVEGYTPQAVGRMVTDMFFLMIAPAAMTVILKQAIDAMVGGDDDDAEEWMTKYFKEQVSYILAMFPFVRETSAAVAGYASYSGPVGARFFADVNKFIRQVAQGEVDENLVKAGVRVAGTPFGIPTSQIIKTYDGMEEMMAGNATPLALLFGPPKKD